MRIGPMEIIIVLIIVILVFGVGKLPDIGKALGQGLKAFKGVEKDIQEEIKNVKADVSLTENKPAPAAPTSESPTRPAVIEPPSPPSDEG